MTIVRLLILALFLSCATPANSERDLGPYKGTYSRSNILVKVDYRAGWGLNSRTVALDCTGTIKVVGVYNDGSPVVIHVPSETAVDLIDRLLGLDFFGLQENYRSLSGGVRSKDSETVDIVARESIDGGLTKVTVYIGSSSHTVSLHNPAYGAPPELPAIVLELKELVSEALGEK